VQIEIGGAFDPVTDLMQHSNSVCTEILWRRREIPDLRGQKDAGLIGHSRVPSRRIFRLEQFQMQISAGQALRK